MTYLTIRRLGVVPYQEAFEAMKAFTNDRTSTTSDEIWFLEHPPVFTQGQAGKPEHVLKPGIIPVIQTDRGGQVTYHGPGQLVMYVLMDLKRLNIGIRQLVSKLEDSVIQALADFTIPAKNRCDAPGVYIEDSKICSIGLRVRKGYSYHGIAFNIAMDLEPFSRINPCGFKNLTVTQVSNFVPEITLDAIESKLARYVIKNFGYNVPLSEIG